MNTFTNQAPYLRTSREFPNDIEALTVEINKTYIDIATAVNLRTIGIFSSTKAAITGETWVIFQNRRQQTLRQVYTFTSTASINHNIPAINLDQYAKMYGQFTDGKNWYGIVSGSNVAIVGQISFYVTSTQIVFLVGAGAPALTKGNIVLEWLVNG